MNKSKTIEPIPLKNGTDTQKIAWIKKHAGSYGDRHAVTLDSRLVILLEKGIEITISDSGWWINEN